MHTVLTLTALLAFTSPLFAGEPESCAPSPFGQAIQFVAGPEIHVPKGNYDTSVYHLKHAHARAMLKALWREFSKQTSDGSPLSVMFIPTSSDDALVAICPREHVAIVKKAIETCDVQALYAVKVQLFEITTEGKTVPASDLSLVVGHEGSVVCKRSDGSPITVKLKVLEGAAAAASCASDHSDACEECPAAGSEAQAASAAASCSCCSPDCSASPKCSCQSPDCGCSSESASACEGCSGSCGSCKGTGSSKQDSAKVEDDLEPYAQGQGEIEFAGNSSTEQASHNAESGTAKPSQTEGALAFPSTSMDPSQTINQTGGVIGREGLTIEIPTGAEPKFLYLGPNCLYAPSAPSCDECANEPTIVLGEPAQLRNDENSCESGCHGCCPACHETSEQSEPATQVNGETPSRAEPPALLTLTAPHPGALLGGIAISPRWQTELWRIYRGRRLSEIFEPVGAHDASAKALGRLLAEIPKPGHDERAETSSFHGLIVVDLPDRLRIFEEVTPVVQEAAAPTVGSVCPVCPDCREEFRNFLEELLRTSDFSDEIAHMGHKDADAPSPSTESLRELPNVTPTKVATTVVTYPLRDLVLLDEHGKPVFDQCTIIDHIQAAVVPESWSQPGISMQFDQQSVSLVVRQTPEVHKLIEAHLRYLHRLHLKQISSLLEKLSASATSGPPDAN